VRLIILLSLVNVTRHLAFSILVMARLCATPITASIAHISRTVGMLALITPLAISFSPYVHKAQASEFHYFYPGHGDNDGGGDGGDNEDGGDGGDGGDMGGDGGDAGDGGNGGDMGGDGGDAGDGGNGGDMGGDGGDAGDGGDGGDMGGDGGGDMGGDGGGDMGRDGGDSGDGGDMGGDMGDGGDMGEGNRSNSGDREAMSNTMMQRTSSGTNTEMGEHGNVTNNSNAKKNKGVGAGASRSFNREGQSSNEFNLGYDDLGYEEVEGELLLLVDQDDVEKVLASQTLISAFHALPGLKMGLFKFSVSADQDIAEFSLALAEQYDSAVVEGNHLYTSQKTSTDLPVDCVPLACAKLLGWPARVSGAMRIGIIDTGIDLSHPALQSANITTKAFAQKPDNRSLAHGTAITSILVGNQTGLYQGLAPNAHIFSANVFSSRSLQASTEAILQAMDWMAQHHVAVVNLSLAGPPDATLEAAIKRLRENGNLLVAAVGNDGPAAPAMYPAAYDTAIAVTAVDTQNIIYRRAVRGDHVDLSAPGVGVLAAIPGGAYGPVTGTSIAAPFVTALLAYSSIEHNKLDALEANARDLGATGFDPVYGYGLIQFQYGQNGSKP
jgi:Subtilase family